MVVLGHCESFHLDSGQTNACFATVFRPVSAWCDGLPSNDHACSGSCLPGEEILLKPSDQKGHAMKHSFRKQCIAGITASVAMSFSLMVAADTNRAFVPMGTADAVGVIDLENRKVTSSIGGTLNTHGSALTPDGRHLVVGSLSAHDRQEPVSRPEGVSEDEHAAHHGGGQSTELEAGSTGLLYLVNTATKTIDRKLEVPGPVHHVLVTSDSRYAVSTHPASGSISVVDLDSGQLVKTVATGPAPNYLVQTDDGQSLLVSNTGNGTVSEVDTELVRRAQPAGWRQPRASGACPRQPAALRE
ncbi:YncE family protein [Halopseudomonas pachastrellae]|nr:YncE family protein [Halopseudomonas pachastrellae]